MLQCSQVGNFTSDMICNSVLTLLEIFAGPVNKLLTVTSTMSAMFCFISYLIGVTEVVLHCVWCLTIYSRV